MVRSKVTITTLREKVARGEKITMVTGYDYPLALAEEKAGVDIILVGDSLGMTVLGYDSTLPVRMDTMIDHAQAVRRAAPTAYVIGDMPYLSYQISIEQAVANAGRFMKEAGCDAVKLEGGRNVLDVVAALTKATIPVMGHIGLTPQSIAMLGGFKSQGRSLAAAEALIEDAKALEEAGAVALLLEAVPPEVGKIITSRANIPVIGIGAGPYCHGQCLIVHDMLGFFEAFTPKFVKKYADLNSIIVKALEEYISDVKGGTFPGPEHCYKMQPGEGEALLAKFPVE
ncbi:MAG: 3-methyl-2-oxobutanoate hydroxymethyltransferase [Bacillota bacterium]|nr:3-methyl-2-oxobutanoate hydroxymethyltransferase [Bacillota bacterium]MDK2926259.1 3-methyl-2-oxobutanoate hydroxymethyltransferase [Bacillota bacterium]